MKEKILIVDDNNEFRQLLEIFLLLKYEVTTAENGMDALQKLQNGYMPNLIVSDYIMPLVDGKSLVEQIKDSKIFKHIPVIILSSVEKSAASTDLIKSGASAYMVKPFGLNQLGLRIDSLLRVID